MSERAKIFISYARKDGSELASQLLNDLTARGYEVWLDRQRLHGGTNWSREIEQALDQADLVLALLSVGSFESNVCRGEQLRSLRNHKCVIPVLTRSHVDRPVYLEAQQYRDFSDPSLYDLCLTELIGDIESRSGARLARGFRTTRYDTVPPLPMNFVPRPAEVEALRQAILSDRDYRHVALVALKGMGGIGKTVLAQALCLDQAVQSAFPDGIVWVKIGEKPTDADLVGQMREVAKALGQSTEGFDALEGSSKLVRSLLQDKAVLLVLDDVWKADHVYDFQPAAAHLCRVLFTTRNAEIVAATGAKGHSLDVMEEQQSRSLLAAYAGLDAESLPLDAANILLECNGLPLALAMIGAMLRDEPSARWSDVLESLRKADLERIQFEFPNYAYPSLISAIETSVNNLPSDARIRYLELGVLPEDVVVSERVLETVWELDSRVTRELVSIFVRRSLATRDRLDRLALHNLQLDYAKRRVGDLAVLHNRLLSSYERQCLAGWHTGPDDGYFYQHLPYHLREAGRKDELQSLFLNFDWLQKKLNTTDISTLLSDFELWDADSEVCVVRNVMRLSAHALAADKTQLAGQLAGRISNTESAGLRRILDVAKEPRLGARLVPIIATLTGPGERLLRTLPLHAFGVTAVALSSDGRRAIWASRDGSLTVWDLESWAQLRRILNCGWVTVLALSRDGDYAVAGAVGAFNRFRAWDLRSGMEIPFHYKSESLGGAGAAALTADGKHALLGYSDGILEFCNLETGSVIHKLRTGGAITSMALAPDGMCAVSGSFVRARDMWDVKTGSKMDELPRGTEVPLAITSDGYAVLYCDDKTVKVWNPNTGTELRMLTIGEVDKAAVTLDAKLLVAASKLGALSIWNLQTRSQCGTLGGHTGPVIALAITEDCTRAISASHDDTIKVWDLTLPSKLSPLTGHAGFVHAVAVTRNSRFAVSASADQSLRLWDLKNHKELRTLLGHNGSVNTVAVPAKRSVIVSGSNDQTIKLWDLETGIELRTLSGHAGAVAAVAVTADGRRAVSASSDGTLKMWNLEEASEICTICENVHAGEYDLWANALAITDDGTYAIWAFGDNSPTVWNLLSRTQVGVLAGHEYSTHAMAVTPDNHFVVTGSSDQTLKVWDVEAGTALRTLSGHRGSVDAVVVTADGKRAISASHDQSLKMWDIETGSLIASFDTDGWLTSCAVTPDGSTIVCGDARGKIHMLQVQ